MAVGQEEQIWKHRYDALAQKLQSLSDEVETAKTYPQSDVPMSESQVLYISYDWDVCDTVEMARKLYGDRFQVVTVCGDGKEYQ